MVAKFNAICADSQTHECIKHLGMTHMLGETFAIAHHNTYVHLAQKSKHANDNKAIGAFLAPHFINLLAINSLAKVTLLADVNNNLA